MKKTRKYILYTVFALLLMLLISNVAYAASDASAGGILETIKAKIHLNFIKDDRWKYITDGLKRTLLISFFAVIIGIVLGFIIAVLRSTFDTMDKKNVFTRAINGFLKAYLTVIRGTPALIQLMIIYFVIFAS